MRGMAWLVVCGFAAAACTSSARKAASDAGDGGASARDSSTRHPHRDASASHDASPARMDAGHDASTSGAHPHMDAGHDASASHDAALDAFVIADDAGGLPTRLSETGLYSNTANGTLATGVQAYEPAYFLWSDGAAKKRYFYLPPGAQIDTSNMDGWVFPVGTKAWKEFTRDGVRVETRLVYKIDASTWFMMAFIWNQAQTDAVAAPAGMMNAHGTLHDVPSAGACRTCHDGMADKLLGVSAIALSHSKPGMTLTTLANAGKLSAPPAQPFALPGTATDQAALGALHANCGHCHNPLGIAWDRTHMQLELLVSSLGSVAATTTYTTTVGQALESMNIPGAGVVGTGLRIDKGSPNTSGLVIRLESARDGSSPLAMPSLATELSDPTTATAVRTWVQGLM